MIAGQLVICPECRKAVIHFMLKRCTACSYAAVHTYRSPLADRIRHCYGLASYRYMGRYGWIFAGARDTADAMKQLRRSTDGPLHVQCLERFDSLSNVWSAVV